MVSINRDIYLDKSYAGLIGMVCGVIYGSPIESGIFNQERIKRYLNVESNMLFSYSKYAADDDINGPLIFSKAFLNNNNNDVPSKDDFKNVWLDNIRYEKGMFWWGPSTERYGYEKLVGISREYDDIDRLQDQIGGQIFIDTWGIIYAGEPKKAVEAAVNCASISHNNNGLEGARFISACISNAYLYDNIYDVINSSLIFLNPNLEYKSTLIKFIDMYNEGVSLECALKQIDSLDYSISNGDFGHIIPNAAIIIISLLWGEGDFEKSLNISLQASWDTDCNGSNVGTILGVLNGCSKIKQHHFDLVNDEVILSGAVGSENILSLSSWLKNLYEKKFDDVIDDVFYHKYATFGISVNNKAKSRIVVEDKKMCVLVSGLNSNQSFDIFKKTFYTKKDLQDTRYQPVFDSILHSGNKLSIDCYFDSWQGDIDVKPYVKVINSNSKTYCGDYSFENNNLSFNIPEVEGKIICEVGLELKNNDQYQSQTWGEFIINDINLNKDQDYKLNMNYMISDLDTVTPYSISSGGLYLTDKFFEHDMNQKVMRYYAIEKLMVISGTTDKYNYKKVNYLLNTKYNKVGIIFDGFGLSNYSRLDISKDKLSVVEVINNCENIIKEFKYAVKSTQLKIEIVVEEDKLYFNVNDFESEKISFKTRGSIHGLYSNQKCEGEVVDVSIKLVNI